MPLLRTPPVIFPFFGHRSATRLRIAGRALRNRPPRWDHDSRLAKMRALASHFASREYAGLPVQLEIRSPSGESSLHAGFTDDEGYLDFDLPLENWAMPRQTEWETVCFTWNDGEGAQSTEGYVLAPGADSDLAVISDIDDTIIETGITGGFRSVLKNWRRILAQMPAERVQVPGSDRFYSALSGGLSPAAGKHLPATRHPFFYVSSSPWNLFAYLTTFIRSRGLPLGPLELRDWGLNRETFGSASHGEHKVLAMRRLLNFYPDLRFALIGDDTQADLTAFARIAWSHKNRIAAIFIRQAGEAHSPEEEQAKADIRRAGVPLWLGSEYDVGRQFLDRIGLAHDHEAERIVETVSETGSETGSETANETGSGEPE
jgi:phosphatidate phosphatase APP1